MDALPSDCSRDDLMHVLGKVLLGFVVVGAIAAIVLTTMTLGLRTHWEQQVAQARQEYAEIEKDLNLKRTQHRVAQEELDRVKQPWGNVWRAPNSRPVNPANGTVSIGAGLQDGLGQPATARSQNPSVFVFNVDGNQSQYLGEFRIRSAQAGSADAQLIRPPYPGESFPAGNWRIRDTIPYNFATRLSALHTQQIASEARLNRMKHHATVRQEQLAASQNLLQQRIYQLDGDPTLDNPSELQKVGYVQAIRDGLTERDRLIARLHDLRVERRLKYESLVLTQQENAARLRQFEAATGTSPEYNPPAAAALPASAN